MKVQKDYRSLGCRECAGGAGLGFDFSMAFQPSRSTAGSDASGRLST